MLRIPAISILDGKFVIVGKDGDYEAIEDEDGKPVDPVSFLEELVRRKGEIIYINDINGMENNSPQYGLLKKLVGTAELWVDAGSRSGDALVDVIFAGAQRAVLSTKTVVELDEVDAALDVSDGIMLCIDYDRGIIARNREIARMTPRKLADEVKKAGVCDVIFADHGRKKKGEVNRDILFDLVRSGVGVYTAGNIVENDMPVLEKLGVKGVLLDMGEVLKAW